VSRGAVAGSFMPVVGRHVADVWSPHAAREVLIQPAIPCLAPIAVGSRLTLRAANACTGGDRAYPDGAPVATGMLATVVVGPFRRRRTARDLWWQMKIGNHRLIDCATCYERTAHDYESLRS
jgi:hypothetical protein